MSEPTSVLTFNDLILEVAYKLGIAYYGAAGDLEPEIPIDTHDLILCKRIVNKAIRMFIHDAPMPNGWRWTRPVASTVVWGTIAVDSTNKFSSSVFSVSETTLVVPTAAFYPTMELKPIVITGVGTFTISTYISSTSVKVTGNASTAANKTWSMTADGNYTLPQSFGGQYVGEPTYAAGTNRGTGLTWTSEGQIRQRRSNMTSETGTPYELAVRIMDTGTPRHRWELMTYRMPGEVLTILFPYILQFDTLVNLTDTSPAPFGHDETLKAACLAVAEKEVEDTIGGPDWTYYSKNCLPNSYRVDALAAPKSLGYFGNPSSTSAGSAISNYRDNWYQRPSVTFNG